MATVSSDSNSSKGTKIIHRQIKSNCQLKNVCSNALVITFSWNYNYEGQFIKHFVVRSLIKMM